ncbi:hypothetical protein HPB50_001843 [Hyalomma asiaticum]|uniref:Uncharacterized protein n=1 Tax=Hyalomma asiaticum TaxID=266040 RepID=A0ACB7SDE8_HYAAI|nr:hypothetical protein HPB50_001843 [Hyalomma asiaticum]
MRKWQKSGKEELNTLIRKSVKKVLSILAPSSTERLQQLRVQNTLEQIIQPQETAQVLRLSSSSAKILDILVINPTLVDERPHEIQQSQMENMRTAPLPRKVHPLPQ